MQLKLVENEPKYWEFIRNLRNDPKVKVGFVQQDYISQDLHKAYMISNGEFYYICLLDNLPVGYTGIIGTDIRVATHPDFQGKGIGRFMINELMRLHPDASAKVKIENEASLRLFRACGFKEKYYILEKAEGAQ